MKETLKGVYAMYRNLASSTWSTENVTTSDAIKNEDNTFNVTCESQHLTSFSVLVNVNNLEVSVSLLCIVFKYLIRILIF